MTHVLTLGRNLKNDRHLLVLFSTHYVACCCRVVSTSGASVMYVLSAFLLGSAGLLDSLIKCSIPVFYVCYELSIKNTIYSLGVCAKLYMVPTLTSWASFSLIPLPRHTTWVWWIDTTVAVLVHTVTAHRPVYVSVSANLIIALLSQYWARYRVCLAWYSPCSSSWDIDPPASCCFCCRFLSFLTAIEGGPNEA